MNSTGIRSHSVPDSSLYQSQETSFSSLSVTSSGRRTTTMTSLRSLVVAMTVVLLVVSTAASPFRDNDGERRGGVCDPRFSLAEVTCPIGPRCYPRCETDRDCIGDKRCCPDQEFGGFHCSPPFYGFSP
ncbi:uncharacterized protein LOC143028213 [Oratosquilla oratoria]|uniref:uncharacterized protein LOC143028213 n=1 Tax=Oratosquilla oratoria TaxID=337810 RepID=UPI003F75E63B